MKNLSLVITLVMLAGCSTMTHRGVVAMKINDSEAHVGAGDGVLQLGDHVELYRNQCGPRGKADIDRTCLKKSTGHGTVTQIINQDYSVVKFDNGVIFSEGDMIEKHAH